MLSEKIPELLNNDELYLGGSVIRNLTDEEFKELWEMENKIIHVSNKSKNYIEVKRKVMGLIKTIPDNKINLLRKSE